jgi:hypothetical protein
MPTQTPGLCHIGLVRMAAEWGAFIEEA